jgi:hypothetical protein
MTSAMLLPTSMVEMKLLGWRKKYERIDEVTPGLRFISKRSLSIDTNAISMPEKKAENSTDISK